MEKKNRIQELEEKSASPTVSSSLRCPRRVAVRPLLPRANGVSMKLTEIIKHQHKKLIDFHFILCKLLRQAFNYNVK